jgi:hypothetical protein
MKTTAYRTLHQVAELGSRALVQSLGPSGALEFLHQYERGEGDYTHERRELLRSFRLENLRAER